MATVRFETAPGHQMQIDFGEKQVSVGDTTVRVAVKGWRYRPLMANNIAVPFCFFANFEFKAN